MTSEERARAALREKVDRLSVGQASVVEDFINAVLMPIYSEPLAATWLATEVWRGAFAARLKAHHALSIKPLAAVQFEAAFNHACEVAGWEVEPAGSATQRFFDTKISADGGPVRKLSLKVSAEKRLQAGKISISKLTEGAWIQDARRQRDRRGEIVKLFKEYQEAVSSIFMLRGFVGEALRKLKDKEDYQIFYELLEIPTSILEPVESLTILQAKADTMRVIQRIGTLYEVYPVRRHGTIKRWPVRERIELRHLIHRTGHHMYHTTGFDREEIIDLCILINSVQPEAGSSNWPLCLGLFKSVVATLTYMRHNRTQAEIGESLGVSQPTISRAISAITPLVPEATRAFVPTADDLDPDAQYILDGTLLSCWSWEGHQELYSGKHKTTGMNVQVACNIYGKLAWISDPVNGSRHDNYCQEESGVLAMMNPKNWIGDKGYIGSNMITPFRKLADGELLDWQKEYNSAVNKIRWMIEQVISHFKNWTIMHTDYRRPLKTFETTISAVIGLHFYRTA